MITPCLRAFIDLGFEAEDNIIIDISPNNLSYPIEQLPFDSARRLNHPDIRPLTALFYTMPIDFRYSAAVSRVRGLTSPRVIFRVVDSLCTPLRRGEGDESSIVVT